MVLEQKTPMLHLLCGKVASGKSTLCAELARSSSASIVIDQDSWMAKLYPEELKTVADYIRLIPRLRAAIGPHIVALLTAGFTVVLDWPANTSASRNWMRCIFEKAGASHKLHWLDVPDEVCLARLEARNVSGTHDYKVSKAEFDELISYFEPPKQIEGFDIKIYRWS